MTSRTARIHALIVQSRNGDPHALERLVPLVYDDLRRIAHYQLRGERDGHTLNTTALVHEAYLSLAEGGGWRDRAHFLAAASTVMRHILIDYARRRNAQKRGGDRIRITLEEELVFTENRTEELVALDDALARLGEKDARLEKVVEYRFFGGMTVRDTAEALGVSKRTVERDWTRAKAYLYRALAPRSDAADG